MVARGALIKPWLIQEVKERRHIDFSATQRLEMIQRYCHYALDHYGSDMLGVRNARLACMEWLSFLYRYVPVGLLETLPARISDVPRPFRGRDEMETLLCGRSASDWLKITEMFLGKADVTFSFEPKHKSNAWQSSDAQ